MEYYQIKTSYAHYYAQVWQQYPNIHKVYVGGKKKCVSFSVYLDLGEEPNIDGLGYDQACNTSMDHIKGKGTVHLLKCAMAFVVQLYAYLGLSKFKFNDSSFIQCDKNYVMRLQDYYLTYHGGTWYEVKMGAVPCDVDVETYKSDKEALRKFLGSKLPIDALHKFPQGFKAMYEQCSSLREFLGMIKDYDCLVFKPWLGFIVTQHIHYIRDMEWIVEVDLDVKIEFARVKEKPKDMFVMQGGGGDVLVMHRED